MTTKGISDHPTGDRLPWRRRLPLAFEVLRAYVPALRSVRGNDLAAMVAEARRVRPTAGQRAACEHGVALRLGRATQRTLAVVPTDARCLVRSVVVLRLMARRGISGRLVIGVKAHPDFCAHAWVEHDGRPVTPEGDFVRLLEV